jgi:hypothetical protein
MSLLITPMWTSGKPPGSVCNAWINLGKLVASAACLGSIEGELSTMNKMSTARSGLTRTAKSVSCCGFGRGCCSLCELQAHRAKGRAGITSPQRR